MASQGESSPEPSYPPIKYNVWWRTNKSPADPPSLHKLWWWRDLKFSRLTLEELVRSVRGEEITHLVFDDNPTYGGINTLVPADLPEAIKHSLKHLVIRGVGDKQQVSNIISCLSNMRSLESFCLYETDLRRISDEMRDILMRLKLKHLTLYYCNVTADVLTSISQMKSLEELYLSGNNLSRDGSLSDKLSTLTSLKRLYLSWCQLTEIPQSIQGMRDLEKLDASYNQIEFIPEWIGSLVSLRELSLSGNKTLKKLHRNINSLPLTKLNLSLCVNLSDPPKYVCEGGLENIKQYYTDIDRGSHSLTLATVVVIGRKMAGKTSLIKSLKAKKKVTTNRRDGALGQTVERAESSGVDETTKVFNLVDLCLTDPDGKQRDKTVNVVDFGGDEVYHHAYQLTFRKDCKPIVVVNIIQYEEESQMYGRREATRRVLFDWLAHLYLACPQLDRPLLVLTHRDLAGQRFVKLKEEFMTTMTELYREMLQDKSVNKDMKIMMSTNQGNFFLDSEVFEIDHLADYRAVYAQLEHVLYQRVSSSEVVVPLSWKEIMESIKSRQQSHVTTTEMFSGLKGDSMKQMMVVLDFMKISGQILWYKSEEDESMLLRMHSEGIVPLGSLADVIFHDVSKVTDMIKTLFDHSSAESKSVLGKADMEQMWQGNASGADSSRIPTDIAIQLLTKFNIIYGPTTVNHNPNCYLIPYFMKKQQFTPGKADINLQGEISYVGLSIPVYAYQQMTVSFLKLIQQSEFDVHAFGNGASGRLVIGIGAASEETVIEAQLVHEPENQKVVSLIQGDVSQVHRCWELFLEIMKTLSDTVKSAWPASLMRYDIICPHCLLLEDLTPEKRTNPGFIMDAIISQQTETLLGLHGLFKGRFNSDFGRTNISGRVWGEDHRHPKMDAISSSRMERDYREDCRCRNGIAVPSPLRHPCGELQQQDMLSLVNYIRSIRPDEQQEIVRLMEERDDGVYTIFPTSQTTLHPPLLVEKVYKMTNTRGRVLIINNRHGDITAGRGGRRGSDKDYTNMTNMWERFGFIISHFSRDGDWNSYGIVKAVHQETELVYEGTTSVHEGLGMFVLVMMSHGDIGTIAGCDGKHVNLVDIYKLLSSQYFPAMRGKPKLVILQACSGVREVRKRRASEIGIGDPPTQNQPMGQQNQQTNQQPGQLTVPQQPTQSPLETNIDHGHETIDDLLVMKPSFDEHKSYRVNEDGSYFIGALVAAFYRYAGEKDLCTLSQMIQDVVREEARLDGVEQVPVTISTFTNGRKLYLSPGVNMRTTDHPDSFTSRELPPPERQRISLNWRDDEEASVRLFEVVRNARRVS